MAKASSNKKTTTTKRPPVKGAPTKSSAKKKTSAPPPEPEQPAVPLMWVYGGVALLLGVLAFIGFFLHEGSNDGFLLRYFRSFLMGVIGYGYWVFPFAMALLAWVFVAPRRESMAFRITSAILLPILMGGFLHLILCGVNFTEGDVGAMIGELYLSGQAGTSGGIIAGGIAMLLQAALSKYVAVPLLLLAFTYCLLRCFYFTIRKFVVWLRERSEAQFTPDSVVDDFYDEPVREKPVARSTRRSVPTAADMPLEPVKPRPQVQTQTAKPAAKLQKTNWTFDIPLDGEPERKPAVKDTTHVKPLSMEEAADLAGVDLSSEEGEKVSSPKGAKKAAAAAVAAETAAIASAIDSQSAEHSAYQLPPVSFLKAGSRSRADATEEVEFNRDRLATALNSFGVNANIRDITRGPTVTRYDLQLEAGVKLNKITNLANDLALALGVENVRIAPVPDKISTVGIEVPNKVKSTIGLRDIIDTNDFRNAKSKVSFAVGKDIGGNNIIGNISRLPHMLIAGTTGSGKSVCLNSLILSLLYEATPDEVRLIMIDPKMVEFTVYNGIPHLYIPVVNDPKKAAGALQWAVVEMLKRYRLFSEVQVRDLKSYNELQESDPDGEKLPTVVIIIDELADLMLCAAKEVEESICRVAQMGRAAGMHLIIATQRPSADVITGLMKANIPSRIALSVSSALESRIILDNPGAEKLMGNGDMLYAPVTLGKPLRVQGAFVSDEEREEVINFIKQNSEADYSQDIMDQVDQNAIKADTKGSGSSSGGGNDAAPADKNSDYDELLPQGVDVILETGQASVSMLQRRLKLGYSRAARLVDQMEEMGVVGPFEGSKPRKILITREQWQEMQLVQGTAPGEVLRTQMDFADETAEETNDDEL